MKKTNLLTLFCLSLSTLNIYAQPRTGDPEIPSAWNIYVQPPTDDPEIPSASIDSWIPIVIFFAILFAFYQFNKTINRSTK
jgi:hypothetical protein